MTNKTMIYREWYQTASAIPAQTTFRDEVRIISDSDDVELYFDSRWAEIRQDSGDYRVPWGQVLAIYETEVEEVGEPVSPVNHKSDFDYLPENVAMHTMMRFYDHGDGRGCGYHSRLGKWTFGDIYECLRTHED